MRDIVSLLASDQAQEPVHANYPHGRSLGLPMYDLEHSDLCAFSCLIISNSADQRYLQRRRAQLQSYLEQGGRIAFSGHVAYPFLDALSPYQPTPEPGLAGLQVHNLGQHPIWAGISDADLTFRKGVAGFYGRGYNPPPPGALVTATLGTQQTLPLDWILRLPSGGELLVHAGNDFLSFSNAPSAVGMHAAFFDWAAGLAPKQLTLQELDHVA